METSLIDYESLRRHSLSVMRPVGAGIPASLPGMIGAHQKRRFKGANSASYQLADAS